MINYRDFDYSIDGLLEIIYNLLGNILLKNKIPFFFQDQNSPHKMNNPVAVGTTCIGYYNFLCLWKNIKKRYEH